MRRGLLGALLGCLSTAASAAAQTPVPLTPLPAEIQPVQLGEAQPGPHRTPSAVIPMKSDAGIPFVATPEPCPTVLGPDPRESQYVPRLWFSSEYLLQWMKGMPVAQPLVTTSTVDPFTNPGVLGRPGTVVLFGGDKLDFDFHSGMRLSGGVSLDAFQEWAVDASLVWFQKRDENILFNSDAAGNPVISRPIIDPVTDQEGVFLVSFPNNFAGRIVVSAQQQHWGTEANLIRNVVQGDWGGIDFFAGARYMELTEELDVDDAALVLPQSTQGGRFLGNIVGPGNVLAKSDSFDTKNRYFGGQIGVKAEFRRGNWFLLSKTKLGLGNTNQVLDIGGSSTLFPAGGAAPISVPGGLLALSTNTGRHEHNDVSFVPEVNLNFGYQVSEGIRVYVGYDFMYWSSVIRPGNAFDRSINRNLVPTSEFFGGTPLPQEPLIFFRETDFWLQGVNFGVAVRF